MMIETYRHQQQRSQENETFGYDAAGNITGKSGVGTYSYGTQGTYWGGPHAVTGIVRSGSNGVWNYHYDACGNMLTGADRTYTWNSENKPLTINNSATGATATFSYGPGGEILTENLYGRTVSQVVTHIGGIYDIVEKVDTVTRASGEILQRAYVAGVCVVTQSASAADAKIDKNKKVWKRYMHGDHLGSVEAITDERGNVLQRFDYDVWGAQRNTQSVSDNGPVPITERGFTGHEELADLGLVHMIGRVYDPLIGRFCSADPTVQAPGNSQSFNRYSYCINNPLSLTDPTGYSWLSEAGNWAIGGIVGHFVHPIAKACTAAGKWISQNWRTVVVAAATIVASVVTLGVATGWCFAAATFWDAVAAGTIGGAMNGGLSTALYGGSISQILQNTLKGAVIGGATAAATFGVAHMGANGGSIFGDGVDGWAATKATEMGIGGGASEAGGGDFKSGAVGALGGIVSGEVLNTNSVMMNTVIAGAVGGTVSKLCGGSFANGAVMGAFVYLFNDALHKANASYRQRILQSALDEDGSDWYGKGIKAGPIGAGYWKCFWFVDDTLASVGLSPVCYVNGRQEIPLAGDWAESNTRIFAYSHGNRVGEYIVTNSPEAGDIVAFSHRQWDDASGHCAIVTDAIYKPNPNVIAAHETYVYQSDFLGSHQGPGFNSVYRTFKPYK